MLDNVDCVVYFTVADAVVPFSIFAHLMLCHVIFVYEIWALRFSLIWATFLFAFLTLFLPLSHSCDSFLLPCVFLVLFHSHINVTTGWLNSRSFQFIFITIQQHHWRSFDTRCTIMAMQFWARVAFFSSLFHSFADLFMSTANAFAEYAMTSKLHTDASSVPKKPAKKKSNSTTKYDTQKASSTYALHKYCEGMYSAVVAHWSDK